MQRHRAFGAEVDAFVKPLRDHHGALGRVAKSKAGLLLQRAGREGRPAASLAGPSARSWRPDNSHFEAGDDVLDLVFALGGELFAIPFGEFGPKRVLGNLRLLGRGLRLQFGIDRLLRRSASAWELFSVSLWPPRFWGPMPWGERTACTRQYSSGLKAGSRVRVRRSAARRPTARGRHSGAGPAFG